MKNLPLELFHSNNLCIHPLQPSVTIHTVFTTLLHIPTFSLNNFSVPDSEQSPGVYLRDDPLFGNQPPHCELRVPTAEKAAHYLDAAVEGRQPTKEDTARDSHLLFTLHVYQYSVAGKGGG